MIAPLVTIIVPCYNVERWLSAALDSTLAQTYRPIEIVAVDDGSTDSTPVILAEYRKRHPLTIRIITQRNRGQSAAVNAGFSISTGNYIKFFDADDLISPDAVEVQVTALAGKPRHLAYGAWSRFYTDPSEAIFRSRTGWHNSESPLEWIHETWANTEPMYQCGLWLIPRILINQAGTWDERLSLINDFEFFTRLALAADGIVHTPNARLYYRSGLADSLSGRKSQSAWESAVLSTRLATRLVLAREDNPRSRRLVANLMQQLVFSLYPEHPELYRPLLDEISAYGGSDIVPGGGFGFRTIARILGWRIALRLRTLRRTCASPLPQ